MQWLLSRNTNSLGTTIFFEHISHCENPKTVDSCILFSNLMVRQAWSINDRETCSDSLSINFSWIISYQSECILCKTHFLELVGNCSCDKSIGSDSIINSTTIWNFLPLLFLANHFFWILEGFCSHQELVVNGLSNNLERHLSLFSQTENEFQIFLKINHLPFASPSC